MKKNLSYDKLGQGEKSILIVPTIHGMEPIGVEIVRRMKLQLSKEQNIPNTILLIKNANPWGYEHNKRDNDNEVDLNRNFPTKNWEKHTLEEIKQTDGYKKNYSGWGGPEPASEEETRFILEIEKKYHPEIIISIHQCMDIAPVCVNFDGPAKKLAGKISEDLEIPVKESVGYPTPGSLGNYFGVERQRQTITLELPTTDLPEELVQKTVDNFIEICLSQY